MSEMEANTPGMSKATDPVDLLEGPGMELNPNHPTTKSLHNQWAKIAALIMWKQALRTVSFTSKDIEDFGKMFGGEVPTIVGDDRDGQLKFHLVPLSVGERMMKEEKNEQHR